MSNIIDAKVENILYDIWENYEISSEDMELLCWHGGHAFPPKRNTDFDSLADQADFERKARKEDAAIQLMGAMK